MTPFSNENGQMTTAALSGLPHHFITLCAQTYRSDSSSFDTSVRAGVIGGITVLVGVLFAEWLTLRRETANRFSDAWWVFFAQSANVFFNGSAKDSEDVLWRSSLFLAELGKLHSAAHWPLHNHKEVRDEVEEIIKRFQEAQRPWREVGQIPSVEFVLGAKIGPLARDSSRWPRWWWAKTPKPQ